MSRYAPVTPWRPIGAVVATLGIIVLSYVVAMALAPAFARHIMTPPGQLAALFVSQAAMGLGGWWLAGTRGGDRRNVLALAPIQVSVRAAALSIVGMFLVIATYQAIRYFGLGHDIFADMQAMMPLFSGWFWPLTFLLVAVVAPVAEEVLFRGFLQSAFARSPQLFWVGVVVTTLIWTALHVQYKWPALLLVVLMGLSFSWMLRWSGSLRLPIIAHMANNTVASLQVLLFMKA